MKIDGTLGKWVSQARHRMSSWNRLNRPPIVLQCGHSTIRPRDTSETSASTQFVHRPQMHSVQAKLSRSIDKRRQPAQYICTGVLNIGELSEADDMVAWFEGMI